MQYKRPYFIIAMIFFLASGCADGFVHPQHFEGCDAKLWDHIYHPKRLTVVEPCTKVTGILESAKTEADGDYHIRLKLDPQFANLINNKNTTGQKGDLVLEPICQNPVTQADAVSACENFMGNVKIPKPGSHVEVLGSYVLDTEHGWMETHPITKLNITNP